MSGDGHDYEALHGTQKEQAKAQAKRGTVQADGPYHLFRWVARDNKPERVTLPNSVRTTRSEAEALRDRLEIENDIRWIVERCENG